MKLLQLIDRGIKVIMDLGRKKPPNIKDSFDLLYSLKNDPFNYEKSEYERSKYQATLDIIKKKPLEKILEAGCSEGVFTNLLAPCARSILAIDISEQAVERAQKRNRHHENIRFKVMDIEKKDPEETFNLIICSEMLYYLDDEKRIETVAKRFIKCLEPHGEILLVHMRRTTDDEKGAPPPPLGYPSMGARTVHKVFRQIPELSTVTEILDDKYIITLFQKT